MMDKLDTAVSTTIEDSNADEFAAVVDHQCLVDDDARNMVVIKDILHLPKKTSSTVLHHPVITTFIERRWMRTRWTFLISFTLYLAFVLLFSSFLWLMYERYGENDNIRIPVKLPTKCEPLQPIQGQIDKGKIKNEGNKRVGSNLKPIDVTNGGLTIRREKIKDKTDTEGEDFVFELEVVKKRKNRTKLSRARKHFALFSGCSTRKKFTDVDLCLVEVLLTVVLVILVTQEFWQALALGSQYFKELENWFELLILSLTITTLSLKAELDSLQVVAAVGICLAWIELIFLFGRYPFLGKFKRYMFFQLH